jgi:hypothetical protein
MRDEPLWFATGLALGTLLVFGGLLRLCAP